MKIKPKTKQKTGSRLKRTEILQVRFDAKLRFGAELAAKAQKRTLSSFVEWSVEQALSDLPIHHLVDHPELLQPFTLSDLVKHLWHPDEVVRWVRLAQTAPLLLPPDQEIIWKTVSEEPCFWKLNASTGQREPFIALIKLLWEELQLIDEEHAVDADFKATLKAHILALADQASEEKLAAFQHSFDALWPCHEDPF